MLESRSGLPPVKTGTCPRVAELIDYAQGTIGLEDRQRVETHLQGTGCGYCRRWIARATPNSGEPAELPGAASGGKWQRDAALRELVERLQQLDEMQ